MKELTDAGIVRAAKIPTLYNVADLLTKCHSVGSQDRLMGLVKLRAEQIAQGVFDNSMWGIAR